MEEVQFKPMEMEDKELINSYFRKFPSRSCERTFANSILWSKQYPVDIAVIENALIFRSMSHGEAYAFPAGEEEAVKRALDYLRQDTQRRGESLVLYHVTKAQFEQLESWYPAQFEIEYNRDLADYIYESEKLVTLAGKKLHAKRNHINKFKSNHENWWYETISEDNLEECFQMALKWIIENNCDEDEAKNAEMCVTLNALRLFKDLELTGGILRIDGEIVAFSIGEELCEDTFVVHIEKAFADIQGAYTMINQQFVEHECLKYKYINREEDTGSEGLRKAKLSYRPAFLEEKGIVKEKVQ